MNIRILAAMWMAAGFCGLLAALPERIAGGYNPWPLWAIFLVMAVVGALHSTDRKDRGYQLVGNCLPLLLVGGVMYYAPQWKNLVFLISICDGYVGSMIWNLASSHEREADETLGIH